MSENLTKRKQQALETKKRIYTNAVELFKIRPFDEITIKDICEKAGVSVGVFYHYYKSKSDIFLEGYIIFDSRLDEYIDINYSEDPAENIRRMLMFYVNTINEMGPIYRNIFLDQELTNKPELINGFNRSLNKKLLTYINQSIQAGALQGDALDIYNDLNRVIKGTIYYWSLNNGNFDIEEESKRLMNIILDYYKQKR